MPSLTCRAAGSESAGCSGAVSRSELERWRRHRRPASALTPRVHRLLNKMDFNKMDCPVRRGNGPGLSGDNTAVLRCHRVVWLSLPAFLCGYGEPCRSDLYADPEA